MRVLITGVTGFIGNEISNRLKTEKIEIVGISRNKTDENFRIKILKADITKKSDLSILLKEGSFDAVIHCAGLAHQFGKIERERFENINVKGAENIADLAVKIKSGQFILLSSTAVYGLQKEPMDEYAECHPDTFYAESKLKAEIICREICEQNKIPLTIFRLSPVLGEKGVGNIPRLIRAIDNRKFIWVGNGENKKSLIFVGDVAEACLLILRNKKYGTEIYNLAAAPIQMRKLVSIISKRLTKKIPGFSIPAFLPKLFFRLNLMTFNLKRIERFSQTFEKWLSEDIYPTEKIKKEYGFEPKTSIEKAIEKQCDWFLETKEN